MQKYDEYSLTKVGNDYDEWLLFGDSNVKQGDLIATINGYDNAILIETLLNQMIEEDNLE